VKETATNHDSGGTNRGDLIGVFAFATKSSGFIDQQRIRDVKLISVESEPHAMAYDSAKGEVFVDNLGSSTVSVISVSTNKVVTTIPVPASQNPEDNTASNLAYDSTLGEIFVTGWLSNNVSVISDATNKVVAVIPVGTNPAGMAFDSHNGILYVADQYYAGGYSPKGQIAEINVQTDKVVGNISVPGGPLQLAYDSHWNDLFVSVVYGDGGLGAFVVISCSTGKVLTPDIRAGDYPGQIAYDAKLGEVFIAASGDYPGDATVTVVNDTTNDVVSTIPLTLSVQGIVLDSATGDLYAPCSNSPTSTVLVLPAVTGQVVATLQAHDTASGVLYVSAAAEIFVTNMQSNSVTVVSDGT